MRNVAFALLAIVTTSIWSSDAQCATPVYVCKALCRCTGAENCQAMRKGGMCAGGTVSCTTDKAGVTKCLCVAARTAATVQTPPPTGGAKAIP